MSEDDGVFVLCLDVLRWLGLSFTRLRRPERGGLVAEDSKLNFLTNFVALGVFLFMFWYKEEEYKYSMVVYAAHGKFTVMIVFAFLLCGNLQNRKFVRIIYLLQRVAEKVERDLGRRLKTSVKGKKTFVKFLVYIGVMTGWNLWTDAHLVLLYGRFFRGMHYFCFYHTTFFTAYFVVTMNHVKERFEHLNAAFGCIVPRREDRSIVSRAPIRARRKFAAWTATFMELREVEGQVSEVFGQQVFLTLLLAFSSITVNAYYFIAKNLYGKGYFWSNVTMCTEVFQHVTVVMLSTRAAGSAANEANKINEIIFRFPVHIYNWEMYSPIKYFTLFTYNHPVVFKAWIFYAINTDSLFKVVLTSSAITAVILQCYFLGGNFDVSK